ncbi:hypothetical protein C0993_004804 [Termitomyces sp. T159_Od127]|nr:hypothetical protein C0993_004804 [Termitomyces sp. T159_Od127]
MDAEDPITQFFPDVETVDLYEVLSVQSDAKIDAIKKAYRRLALVYHPDKHATASDADKAAASTKFQQVGFAYAVLSDEERRLRYDRTGSNEEIDDLAAAYTSTGGSIGEIMNHIPHSTHEDEARFITIISDLIAKGTLPMLDTWRKSVKDEKAKLVRRKQSEKEAKEAEQLAKELGVWDEFYGSGKKGKRKTEGKGKKQKDEKDGEEEDHSALQALILKKRQKNMDSFFDGLAAKYAEPTSKTRGGKKRGRVASKEDEGLPTKKIRKVTPQPPNDEEFEKLQASMFGDKASRMDEPRPKTVPKTRRKVQ